MSKNEMPGVIGVSKPDTRTNHITRQEFNIKDESQDKKYFSIVPNYVVNHSTLGERGFYLTLKRIAGEYGTVRYSARDLAKICAISDDTVYRLIKSLTGRGWIKEAGKIPTGHKPRQTYSIVDLWKQNIDFYSKKEENRTSAVNKDKVALERDIKPQTRDTEEKQDKEEIKREINKEKALIPLNGKHSSLTSIGEAEFQQIAEDYQVPLSFVISKFDDLQNYCLSKGKKYKDYLAALRNFVKQDAIRIGKEASEHVSKRGIDARHIQ